MQYTTNVTYTNRETKAAYVYDKYKPLLSGSVLDVGADGKYLKPYVEKGGGSYYGIGFGENVDLEIDLDTSPLPFHDRSFDTVLCLDVLEHLEKIHFVFSELCRVSNQHLIISLPNPYHGFYKMLRHGDYSSTNHLKFYGLPVEPPKDRHRWFFSLREAKAFLQHNAQKNGFRIHQVDIKNESISVNGLRWVRFKIGWWILRRIFRSDIDSLSLHQGTLWCVLKKTYD